MERSRRNGGALGFLSPPDVEAGAMNPGLAAGLLFGIVFAALYAALVLALREGGR